MPIYMDRHDLPGVTAKDVAHAHKEDLNIQDQYGCRGITYWFDEAAGSAFCLIDAPNIDAVKNMHNHAHGLIPHLIIEVESRVVEAFLGRIQDPQPDNNIDESGLLILNDSAFRAIMAIELVEFDLMYYRLGPDLCDDIQLTFNQLIDDKLKSFEGRKVEHVNDKLLISFISVSNAIACALAIETILANISKRLKVKLLARIGLSAGVPITEDDTFFGETLKQTKRLCKMAPPGKIFASSALVDYLPRNDLMKLNKVKSLKVLKHFEEDFLKHLCEVTHSFWNDPVLTVQLFSAKMGLSKSQMYRKMVSLTGFSPNEFLNEYRLRKSLKFLRKSQGNISEIAYESGFSSPSYFSKCFYKRYGLLPSDYLRAEEVA